eukprot:4075439-Amphidinium_carterae.1
MAGMLMARSSLGKKPLSKLSGTLHRSSVLRSLPPWLWACLLPLLDKEDRKAALNAALGGMRHVPTLPSKL